MGRNSLSVNKLGLKVAQKLIENHKEYNVKVVSGPLGSTIIDAGIEAKGGIDAGILVAEATMGGLGRVKLGFRDYDGLTLPTVEVCTDHPVIACMASQYAGWRVSTKDYFAMGSGPARALALKPKKLFREIGYKDEYEEALIVLEAGKYPTEEAIKLIAEKCGVKPQNVTVIITPTQSIAGSVQISARIVETGIHKLHTIGFHLDRFIAGQGEAPIAPPHPDPTVAMGRTNDMILYGGVATYFVNAEDSEIAELLKKAPSCTSRDYGKPFYEAFKEAGFDFYKIDPNLFAPAMYVVFNTKTGSTFKAGYINADVLKRSVAYQEVK